jgi:hypothetical protein
LQYRSGKGELSELIKFRFVALFLIALTFSLTFNFVYASPPGETLRPASDLAINIQENPNSGAFYAKVNSETPGSSGFLTGTGVGAYAIFGFPAIGDGSFTITDVTVYVSATIPDYGTFEILLWTNGYGDINSHTTGASSGARGSVNEFPPAYSTYSWTWATNPFNGKPWTIDDINSLKAGIYVDSTNGGYALMFLQLYIVVHEVPLNVLPEYAFGGLLATVASFAAFAFIKRPRISLRRK